MSDQKTKRKESGEAMIEYFTTIQVPDNINILPGQVIGDGNTYVQRNIQGLRDVPVMLNCWKLCYLRLYRLKQFLEKNKQS